LDEAAQPSTARGAATTPPPTQKSAIVTAKRRKQIIATSDYGAEASPEVKAFFARWGLGRGGVTRTYAPLPASVTVEPGTGGWCVNVGCHQAQFVCFAFGRDAAG
jgi:hypothetical protein